MKFRNYFVLLLLFMICCKQYSKVGKEQKSIFIPIKEDILYKDSINSIYLKTSSVFIGTDSIYYEYYNHVSYDKENDSLIELKNIIDVKTFDYLNGSNVFYKDKNYMYVYQKYPATYPPLKIIEINPNKAVIIKNDYIKDDKNVYFLGMKISENATDFKPIPNKDSLLLFGDGKKIIWNWSEMSKDDFIDLSLSKKVKDSLINKYFP